MSILNGKICHKIIKPELPPFGNKFESYNFLPMKGCKGVDCDDNGRYLYVASDRGISIYDIAKPHLPLLISEMSGFTSGRSVRYLDGILYIAARENGLYIVDVKNTKEPHIVSIYNTLELATAVDVVEGYCFVANRHLGVEIVDISNPQKPLYVTSFKCGEAQSVFVDREFAYVGDWMNKKVHIVNISDVHHPVNVSYFDVDGFADGVFVRKGVCYIATGHHSARLKNRRRYDKYPYITQEMLFEGYGCGHGLEIYDVSDPYQPEFMSQVKFPPVFGAPDFWRVSVCENTAFVCDSTNGLFMVDVSDLFKPYIKGYFVDKLSDAVEVGAPLIQKRHAPLSFCLCLNGYIYIGGEETGLHVIKYPDSKFEPRKYNEIVKRNVICAKQVFKSSGFIHSIVLLNNEIYVSAGNDGLYILTKDFEEKAHINCDAMDVKLCGNYVIVAQAQKGIGVYNRTDAGIEFVSRTLVDGGRKTARQISVIGKDLVAIQTGQRCIDFYRIDDNGMLTLVRSDDTFATLYYRNLAENLLNKKYFGYSSLNHGINWYDISDGNINKTEYSLGVESCPIEDGVAVCDEFAVIISSGRYGVMTDALDISSVKFGNPGSHCYKGIPFVFKNLMLLLNRCLDEVQIFDISDLNSPVFVGKSYIPGPSYASEIDKRIFVCCGHDGIYEIEVKR